MVELFSVWVINILKVRDPAHREHWSAMSEAEWAGWTGTCRASPKLYLLSQTQFEYRLDTSPCRDSQEHSAQEDCRGDVWSIEMPQPGYHQHNSKQATLLEFFQLWLKFQGLPGQSGGGLGLS